MDRRTNAIARLNTEEIVNEVNNVIKNGLNKLLGDHLYRYELLERTHEALMNLPSIRNELNQNPYESTQYDFVKEYNTRHQQKNDLDMIKYDLLIEKLTKRIDELTYEINTLKTTMSVKDEEPIKEEPKENIKLVIDTSFNEDDINNDNGNVKEQIKRISFFASEEETSTYVASSVASLEEEEEEEEEEDAEEDEVEDTNEVEDNVEVEDDASEADASEADASEADASEADEVETEKSESDSEEEEQVADEVVVVTSEVAVADEVVVAEVASLEVEEEFIEIDIDDVTYCTNNEENGFIYELTEDGDVGDKVGYLKDGEPFFYADEK